MKRRDHRKSYRYDGPTRFGTTDKTMSRGRCCSTRQELILTCIPRRPCRSNPGWRRGLRLQEESPYRGPGQDENREDTQHRAERHEQAFDASHHRAEQMPLSFVQGTACGENESGEKPSERYEDNRKADEDPSQEDRWRLALASELRRTEHEEQAKKEMKNWKQREQSRHPSDHIVEDCEESQLFFVLVHDGLSETPLMPHFRRCRCTPTTGKLEL